MSRRTKRGRELADLDAAAVGDVRFVLGPDGQDDVLFVEHVVVLEIVEQDVRGAIPDAGQEDRRSRNGDGRMVRLSLDRPDEGIERDLVVGAQSLQIGLASGPCPHHDHDRQRKRDRHPAAIVDLQEVGARNIDFDDEERQQQDGGEHEGAPPDGAEKLEASMVETTMAPVTEMP